ELEARTTSSQTATRIHAHALRSGLMNSAIVIVRVDINPAVDDIRRRTAQQPTRTRVKRNPRAEGSARPSERINEMCLIRTPNSRSSDGDLNMLESISNSRSPLGPN